MACGMHTDRGNPGVRRRGGIQSRDRSNGETWFISSSCMLYYRPDVRFGSKADIGQKEKDRFAAVFLRSMSTWALREAGTGRKCVVSRCFVGSRIFKCLIGNFVS